MACCVQDNIPDEIPGSERFGYASEQIYMKETDQYEILSLLGFSNDIFLLEDGFFITFPNWVQYAIIQFGINDVFINRYFTFIENNPYPTYTYLSSRIIEDGEPPLGTIINIVAFSTINFPRPAPGLSKNRPQISQLTIQDGKIEDFSSDILSELVSFANTSPIISLLVEEDIPILILCIDNTYGNCISGTFWAISEDNTIYKYNFGFKLLRNEPCPLPYYNSYEDLNFTFFNRFGNPLKLVFIPLTGMQTPLSNFGINYIIQ